MNKFIAICLILSVFTANTNAQNITTITKVKDFAMGLSIGMGALAAMPDATQCATEAPEVIKGIEDLINEIKTNPKNVVEIIEEVEKLVKTFTSVLPTCKKLSVEGKAFFGNIANHFTNSTLRNQGFLNIFENAKTIESDVQQGTAAIKSGKQETDFLIAGSKFGDIIKIFVNGASSSALKQQIFVAENTTTISTLTKLKDFVMGLSIGMGALAAMPDATTCVTDLSGLAQNFEALINDIKNDPKKILDIISALEKIFSDFSKDLPICKALSAESKVFFGNLANHFTNSTLRVQGLVNLGNNFQAVEADVEQGITALKTGKQETDFLIAGSKFGAIVNVFVNGGSSSTTFSFLAVQSNSTAVAKLEKLALGVVFGSRVLAQTPHAIGCIGDITTLKTEITQLIADLKNKSIMDAIKLVTEFVKQISPDFTTCNAVKNELFVVGEDLVQAFSNQTRIEGGVANLLKNAPEVIKAVETAAASFKAGEDTDFQTAGINIGDILRLYVNHENQSEQLELVKAQKFLA